MASQSGSGFQPLVRKLSKLRHVSAILYKSALKFIYFCFCKAPLRPLAHLPANKIQCVFV
ncbi:hypothetical protein AUK22_02520 [bacterium CG2_30_54_10]|nr:MAG: hypothetical protein AUK22_02520 [bacterium CG2_30_54_10]